MTSTRVRDLAASPALAGAELFYADDGVTDRKVTAAQIKTFCRPAGELNLTEDFADSVTNWTAYYGAQTEMQTLFIPSSSVTYDLTGDDLVPGGAGAVIEAFGASCLIANLYTGSIPGHLGAASPMARINSVSSPTSTVTLTTPATYATYFPVGTWVCIMGFDLEAPASGTPNNQFFEFAQVTAINVGTGVISLDKQLRHIYKSTWPTNQLGTALLDDNGGIASIFPMSTDWNSSVIIKGMTVANTAGNDLTGAVRSQVFEDCIFTEVAPTISTTKYASFKRCDMTGATMTTDSLVEVLELEKCRGNILNIPSSSVTELRLTDCDFIEVNGTAQKTSIRGGFYNTLTVPVTTYGSSRDLIVANAVVNNFEVETRSALTSAFTSISAGTLTFPRANRATSDACKWLVPGASGFITVDAGGYSNLGACFKVVDVTADVTNYYYKTTLADPLALPSNADLVTKFGSSTKLINLWPTARLSVTNCDGNGTMRSMSYGPKGLPLYSYLHSGMVSGTTTGNTGEVWGRIEKIIVTVHRAYTGALGSLDFELTGGVFTFIRPNLTFTDLTLTVDAKTAGKRIFDLVNGVVAFESSDGADIEKLMDGVGLWSGDMWSPGLSADISAETANLWPIIEMEVIANPGPDISDGIVR